MTPALLSALAAEFSFDEGDRYKVYDDETSMPITRRTTLIGNPTIGRGRNLAARGISATELEFLFQNDMVQCSTDLAAALPWAGNLSPNRQVVLYSLYFNMYLGDIVRFKDDWPHFLEQMRIGAFEDAAHNLETSQPWASQVKTRAARLAALVRSG